MSTTAIDDGGPAFPVENMIEEGKIVVNRGMSLRDYFAAKAMQAIIYKITTINSDSGIIRNRPQDVSEVAYTYADAMIGVRKAGGAA